MKNFLLLLFVLSYAISYSQDSTRASSFSINFTSVPVQSVSGTDTSFINALSVSPVLELRSKSGWGITYSPSFVTSGSKTGIYLHTVSAGYEKYDGKSMDLVLNYSHYYFTQTTNVPYSPLNNEVYFYLNYTHAWLRPVVALSFGFGNDTSANSSTPAHDLGMAFGFNHEFDIEKAGIFSSIDLTPGVLINAGTNEYFSFLSVSKYLSHNHQFIKYVKKGSGKKSTGNNSTPSISLSNLQLSMEGEFNLGSFTLRPTYNIFIPVSSGTDNSLYGYGEFTIQYHF